MQWTTTVPTWPTCTTHDVPPRLQEAINQLIAEYGPPTRGRLRYLDPQIRKWRAYKAFYVEPEDLEKTVPHAHFVASRRAPPGRKSVLKMKGPNLVKSPPPQFGPACGRDRSSAVAEALGRSANANGLSLGETTDAWGRQREWPIPRVR
jgi:hypothetical protein